MIRGLYLNNSIIITKHPVVDILRITNLQAECIINIYDLYYGSL